MSKIKCDLFGGISDRVVGENQIGVMMIEKMWVGKMGYRKKEEVESCKMS